MSLKQYLSVADNARDVVLLHVSASSERQEDKKKKQNRCNDEEERETYVNTQGYLWLHFPIVLSNRAYDSTR